jgi:hypothetical protein
MDDVWDWLVWFCLHRITRYVASWLLALGTAALSLYYAWNAFGTYAGAELRRDGNSGHCTIDFGGQWLMGAMLVKGHGQHLYDRRQQREVLVAAYPPEDEVPNDKRPDEEKGQHDASNLMNWFMGHDDQEATPLTGGLLTPLAATDPLSGAALLAAGQEEWTPEKVERAGKPWVGGPLYPPINAFVYAPLGMLTPQQGYRANQVLCLVYAFVGGLGVSYLTRGRFWWPLAAALIMIYPGFKGAIHLGQNPPLTLLYLIWGWALIARDRPVLGGIVWGMLAFKPVWALAFFLVPLLTLRWRVCVAMAVTGIVQIVATLPFVGLHSWDRWVQVGRSAADLYKIDQNWVFLSRDILGIPRRFMLNFKTPSAERDVPEAAWVGLAMLGTIVGLTILMVILRGKQARQALTGPMAAFLLLGAWMSCFHFMYYDVLLTALPMFVLFAEPGEYVRPIFLAIMPVSRPYLGDMVSGYYRPRLPVQYPPPVPMLEARHGHLWVVNRMVPSVLLLLLFIEHLLGTIELVATVSGRVFNSPVYYRSPVPEWPNGTPFRFQLTTKLWVDGYPWDTFAMIFLWMWCGILWLRTPRKKPAPEKPRAEMDVLLLPSGDEPAQAVELDTNIWSGHQGLANEDRADPGGLKP